MHINKHADEGKAALFFTTFQLESAEWKIQKLQSIV